MNYINLFKNRIKKEVTSEMTIADVSLLFERIKNDISRAGDLIGLPKVDEITLKNYFETAKKEYLSVNTIDPGISHSLTKDGFVSWLTETRENDIDWDYTERYFKYLLKTGRSQKVIDETRRSSMSIIKKIADPKSKNSIYSKGLVVGAVQSGKTGNFNAVINRSIDSGYGLVIVLSGIMEDLRSQTQKRIESDVIGEGRDIDTNTVGKKGAGEIERFGLLGNSLVNQVKSITSSKSDFNRALLDADFSLNDVNVLVCKKNVSVLRNLIIWLHDYLDGNKERHNIPLLILDDEADNASLNNLGAKGRDYASKTNSQIRALLALFNIKTYLGYTATPFANVLQDRNSVSNKKHIEKYKLKGEQVEKELNRVGNIFPDDFIELLDPPSNYVGAKQIFETIAPFENATDDNEKIPLLAPAVSDYINDFPPRVYKDDPNIGIENITKDEWDDRYGYTGHLDFDTWSEYKNKTRASKKDDLFPKKIPESLKDAIKCFVLATIIPVLTSVIFFWALLQSFSSTITSTPLSPLTIRPYPVGLSLLKVNTLNPFFPIFIKFFNSFISINGTSPYKISVYFPVKFGIANLTASPVPNCFSCKIQLTVSWDIACLTSLALCPTTTLIFFGFNSFAISITYCNIG
mgnify:CR=1 FL=1